MVRGLLDRRGNRVSGDAGTTAAASAGERAEVGESDRPEPERHELPPGRPADQLQVAWVAEEPVVVVSQDYSGLPHSVLRHGALLRGRKSARSIRSGLLGLGVPPDGEYAPRHLRVERTTVLPGTSARLKPSRTPQLAGKAAARSRVTIHPGSHSLQSSPSSPAPESEAMPSLPEGNEPPGAPRPEKGAPTRGAIRPPQPGHHG